MVYGGSVYTGAVLRGGLGREVYVAVKNREMTAGFRAPKITGREAAVLAETGLGRHQGESVGCRDVFNITPRL